MDHHQEDKEPSGRESSSPLMLEVNADDLEAVYATLEEYKEALREAEQEISELSAALVEMEDERDDAVEGPHSRDREGPAEEKQQDHCVDNNKADNTQELEDTIVDLDGQLQAAEQAVRDRDSEILRLNEVIGELSGLQLELAREARSKEDSIMADLRRAEAANRRLAADLKEAQQQLLDAEDLHHQGLGADRVGIDFGTTLGRKLSEVEPDAEDKLDDLDKILHSIEALHALDAAGAAVVAAKGNVAPKNMGENDMPRDQVEASGMRLSASLGSIPRKSPPDFFDDPPIESTATATPSPHSASEHYQLLSSPARRRIKSMTSLLSPDSPLCAPPPAAAQEILSDLPPLPPPHHATVNYLRRQDVVMNEHHPSSGGIDASARHEPTKSHSLEEKSTSSLESASSSRSDGPAALSKKGFFFGHKKAVIPIDD